jgi:hypothetical protein
MQARKQACLVGDLLAAGGIALRCSGSSGAIRMIDKIANLVNADANLVRRGRFVDTAKRTGAPVTIMKRLGHFPMSEDPEKFIS